MPTKECSFCLSQVFNRLRAFVFTSLINIIVCLCVIEILCILFFDRFRPNKSVLCSVLLVYVFTVHYIPVKFQLLLYYVLPVAVIHRNMTSFTPSRVIFHLRKVIFRHFHQILLL